MKQRKKYTPILLTTALLLQSLTACGTSQSDKMDSDYTMFLGINSVTATYYTDLNQHPDAEALAAETGLVIDYETTTPGEEDMAFLFRMIDQDIPDILRYNLAEQYSGGVDGAIEEEFIHDITDLVEEYAPNFMARINQDESFRQSAYSDQNTLAYFGATIPDEEIRGLPLYGPMINKTYLDQVGLDVPVTIADWEEMLSAFADLGIIPLSFGAETGLDHLYSAFASAYGVTLGEIYYQEDGTVFCSPVQEGYLSFLELFHSWYENGWIDPTFSLKNQNTDVTVEFEQGAIGATIGHIDLAITGAKTSEKLTGTALEFVPAPYPVLQEGDLLKSRHFTPDFINSPIYITSAVENPIEIIQWVDYFYSEEGMLRTNWGLEGQTYETDSQGTKDFTDHVKNNSETSSLGVLSQEVLRDLQTVQDWDFQQKFMEDPIYATAWDLWQQADYSHSLPSTRTYSKEEVGDIFMDPDEIKNYVTSNTIKFIIGTKELSEYPAFVAEIHQLGLEDFMTREQSSLDRYYARNS